MTPGLSLEYRHRSVVGLLGIGNHLVQLGADSSGWDELYRDPGGGRLWEPTWPQSEMHGGGPPRLTHLMIDAARSKYGAIVDR